MLIKRPIYDTKLACVAMELITHKHPKEDEKLLNGLTSVLENIEADIPLFVPFALKEMLREHKTAVTQPVILKLHAHDIDHRFSHDEVREVPFALALMLNDVKQLTWLELADYVTVNERFFARDDLNTILTTCQQKKIKLIGYDIDQLDGFERCKTLHMDFFCGDFLFQPQENQTQEIAANKLNVIRLINQLQRADVSLAEITDLIQTDPLLSFQLLRLANSAAFSGFQSIDSIQQAVMRLGIAHLRNWIMLISLHKLSNKPFEVLESALIRAYMAQELAQAHGSLDTHSAYTTGLLSILDCLLDKPMSSLLEQIALSTEIKNALINHDGAMGELLHTVKAYEQGHWAELPDMGYHGRDLSEVYINCLEKVSSGRAALACDR